jgi:hypothetical protein
MDRQVIGVALIVAAIVIVICVVAVQFLSGWGLLPLINNQYQYGAVSTPDPAAMDYTVVIDPATAEFDLLLPGSEYHCTCSDYFNGASVECVCE